MGKITSLSDLNGDYSIVYQADAPPLPFVWCDHTIASAKVANGKLYGSDVGGAEWEADFVLLSGGDSVEFAAQVNTINAPASTFLLDRNGQCTRNSQKYAGILKVVIAGDDLALYGTVNHGVVNITVNLRRK